MLDRDALQMQVERGLAQPICIERRFALRMDAHGRCDGELRARSGRRDDDARDPAVDQRIGGGEEMADKRTRRLHRLADHLIAAIERTARNVAMACDVTFSVAQDLLAIEAERGRLVLPVFLQEAPILDVELGVAGACGDAAQALRAFQTRPSAVANMSVRRWLKASMTSLGTPAISKVPCLPVASTL